VQSGDKVPSDMRLLQTRNLQVDESALTGESVPINKRLDTLDHDMGLADRQNMAYASTLVTYGQGVGIVVAIGDKTEVGRISQLISTTEALETPLTRKIARFSHILLYTILALAAMTFAAGLIRGQSAFDMFMAAVALAVGAIPEGLPAAMTITLAIGVSRMARRRAIIRKLPAVETLGSTTVICSDKTGTLTENQMTVQEILAGGERFEVTGAGYKPSGRILKQGDSLDAAVHPSLMECLKAGLLCNDSMLLEKEGRWEIQGDPTEGALLVSASKAGLYITAALIELPRIDSIPFESQHQYMATLHAGGTDKPNIIYIKGSVETIMEKCVSALDAEGRPVAFNVDVIQRAVEEMASRGLRVLACEKGELKQETKRLDHRDVASGMTFLGIQGMIDPPRQETILAVQKCHTAGIRVKMITGDHALTAS
jgi:cation-transporting ATPase F